MQQSPQGLPLMTRAARSARFWLLALILGLAAGGAAILFRIAITRLQATIYATDNVNMLHSHAEALPWMMIILTPIAGGALVGVITQWFIKDGKIRAVADVIEGAALRDGRMDTKSGIASACCSLITLSTGGSTGREGPVVHIAAMLASWVNTRLGTDGITGRDLLGCAVAAAVSASFNAPLAGALFALEVVLRHFALHAIAPIVVASVSGAALSRVVFGEQSEFLLPQLTQMQFYAEMPAFILLGIGCGLVAVLFMRGIFWADDVGNTVQSKLGMPLWVRPMVAGAMLGVIAVQFPHIIGVGYETTDAALNGALSFEVAVIFLVVKVAAVAITMAGRMGGGVFSPALMTGALFGLAFGLVATQLFPSSASTATLYALAGMGGVAGAVFGAPISTMLIVFELTGDWQTAMAVMICVSLSCLVASKWVARSFFLTQLARKGVQLWLGPQAYLLGMFHIKRLMHHVDSLSKTEAARVSHALEQGHVVRSDGTLETAMPLFERYNTQVLCVIEAGATQNAPAQIAGALYRMDALLAYNEALASTAREYSS